MIHKAIRNQRLLFAAAAIMALVAGPLGAVELLTDGAFEFATGIPGWELEESVYDQGTMMRRDFGDVNSAQQQDFGPLSGELALWLRAFVGGQVAGPDTLTNASLSQTVPADPGEEYTFSGWSRWEINYSGGVTTLDASGPLGAAPSPTATTMELAFLGSSGNVLGSTAVDLRDEQNNFDNWVQHTLTTMAPPGTVSARVTADAQEMLWNGGGSESAFYDSFSLTGGMDPESELLANPDLEDSPTPFDPAWTVTEVPGGNLPDDDTIETQDFGNRPESGGQLGVWLRSFTGDAAQPADAIVTQTVRGVAEGNYTFSAWSRFETNYSGGDPSFDTQTVIEMAFLDSSGTEINTPLTLDLFDDGQTNGAGWREHTINGTAPGGTVSVRITGAGLAMETNPLGGQQSAFFDDFSLDGTAAGDFNSDGNWDCDDIDALTAAIAAGSTNLAFDLNGDETIDLADVTDASFGWLAVGVNNPADTGGSAFLSGDANLDGTVDGADFLVWNGTKFTATSAWCAGDFNADGSVDGADFLIWNNNKFTSSDVSAVPEPGTATLLTALLAALGVSQAGRRRPTGR